MACGGLPQCELHYDTVSEKKQGNSTLRLLKVAFEMKRFTQPLTYGKEGNKILLKIGIHCGPVIAGVIGHHKPQFSLIGDTVNTTSRLCSTGRDGKIIISEKAYEQVKQYHNLGFFDRKVDAKGKGELMTYEVKQVKRNSHRHSPKKSRKWSPLEDIKKSLQQYQETIKKDKDNSKKMRLFEEILQKSESPSDLNISSPTPTVLRKAISSQIDLKTFTKPKSEMGSERKPNKLPPNFLDNIELRRVPSLKNEKTSEKTSIDPTANILGKLNSIDKKPDSELDNGDSINEIVGNRVDDISEKKLPYLKLNIPTHEHKIWLFPPKTSIISRLHSVLTPKHNSKLYPRTPDHSSPNVLDNTGFSFFGKELGSKSYQEFDSDEQRHKNKPECIREEEENPSDFSPDMMEQSNHKSLRSEEVNCFIEELENEETFPGEFSHKMSKTNTSFDTVDEEEDFDNNNNNPIYAKNREDLESTHRNLLLYYPITLQFSSQNDEELVQEFNLTLYDDYMDGFESRHGNRVISFVGILVYLLEFLIQLISGRFLGIIRLELIILRMALFFGFAFWFKAQHFLYKINHLKKTSFVLFLLWILTIDLSYSEEGNDKIKGFQEITKFFVVLSFSHFSYVTFLDTFAISIASFAFFIFFEENLWSSKKLFLIFSTLFILYASYRNYLSKLRQFNYCLINKQKKNQQNDLLMHLLPNHIFRKFMINPSLKSELIDEFDDVTMLFADIKGFTEFSAKRSTTEVVNMLRDLFTEFDKLCLKNNVYKLYTIGDCYVVLGMIDGENRNSIEDEAKNIILMAFSMIDTIRLVRKKINYNGLDMRIGIHTGKIIGGIIGTDIVRYDIYGKDVLIANKMESNGKEGHIMVSEVTKNLMEQNYRNFFSFEHYKDVSIPSLKTNIGGYFIYPNVSIY